MKPTLRDHRTALRALERRGLLRGGFSLGSPGSLHYTCQLHEWGLIPHELTDPNYRAHWLV